LTAQLDSAMAALATTTRTRHVLPINEGYRLWITLGPPLVRSEGSGGFSLNVCAFLASAVAGAHPHTIGDPYADADGTRYLAMFGQPVLVFAGSGDVLRSAHTRAVSRGLEVAMFTRDLFATGNDRDDRAAVAAVGREQLDLVGIAVHAGRNVVDKFLNGAVMHP
jgi:hypothetical protein